MQFLGTKMGFMKKLIVRCSHIKATSQLSHCESHKIVLSGTSTPTGDIGRKVIPILSALVGSESHLLKDRTIR